MSEDKKTELQVVQPKPPLASGATIAAIVPTTYEEVYRLATSFVAASMIPASYAIKRNAQGKEVKEWEDGTIDNAATVARLSIGIAKGLEIGLPPVTALSTICVINNRPCLWGDGAVALVQQSGKVESIKDWHEGDWAKGTYRAFYQIKRRDNADPITTSFGQDDAKAAGLLAKKGPWASGYGPRMCFNRARAWALRDGFSDVLMGIGIAEEVRDIPQEPVEEVKPNIASLEAGMPTMLGKPESTVEPPAAPEATTAPAEQRDELTQAIEAGANDTPWTDEERDWLETLDQLRTGLSACENMATFQLFWLDHTKVIASILDKSPKSIQAKWAKMVEDQKLKFKK